MWCLECQIYLIAQHLPGKNNVRADRELRQIKNYSNWMLNQFVFRMGRFPVLALKISGVIFVGLLDSSFREILHVALYFLNEICYPSTK